jgi:pimeloyl-ACP methyl ester carboxylesterase
MIERKFFGHSSLFYRNWMIVLVMTLIVYLLMVLSQANKLFMLFLLPGLYLTYELWSICLSIHPRRRKFFGRYTPERFGLKCENVTFFSRDGTKLSGWHIPGSTRKVVILIHGLGGAGISMANHARLFSAEGYHVFLPDLRAHGNSDGDMITDVSGAEDILAAIDYLRTRSDVDADQVCALGISFGALTVLHAARQSKIIRAIVLESIGPVALEDHGGKSQSLRRWLNYPLNWIQYKLYDFLCGYEERGGVVDSLRYIYPRPVMFISTGIGKERYFMQLFYQAARQPKTLWEVPQASHGGAYVVQKKEYRQRILRLFDQAITSPV